MKARSLRILTSFLLVFVMVFTNLTPAFALISGSGSYVRVKYDGQAMESITVNGVTVNAVYKAGTKYEDLAEDPTYSCAAFVKRFYSKVYGISTYNYYENSTPKASGAVFVETDSPQVGDIVRDDKKIHWAVVKAVNGNVITIAHQNYSRTSGGVTYAKVNCKLNVNESRYTFFTCDLNREPETVTGVTVKPGEHKNTVTWNRQSGFNYTVECKVGDGKFEKVANVTTNKFVHKDLITGTEYSYRIKAYRKTGGKTVTSEEYSKVVSGIPIVNLPDKVENVLAVGKEKRVELSWDAVDTADGYRVYLHTEEGEPTLLQECTLTNTVVVELQNDTTYSFYVKAFRIVDDMPHESADYSTLVSATPAVERPGAPTITTVCQNNRIHISFGNQINYRKPGMINGYHLYRFDAAENDFYLIQDLDQNTTHCYDTDLEIGANYHYRLTSYKISDGKEYESEAVYFSEYFRAFEPDMPADVKIEIGMFTTTLSWKAAEQTAGFEIYKLDETSGQWSYLGDCQSETFTVLGTKDNVSYKIVPYSLYKDIRYYNQVTDGIIAAS